VHLPVAAHHSDDGRAARARRLVPRRDRRPDAAVLRVANDSHAGASGLRRAVARVVLRGVVDDDDLVDEGRHRRHCLADPPRFVVGGEDDSDPGTGEHERVRNGHAGSVQGR
jgi:hypothetical protein